MLVYRVATAHDAEKIAVLHVASWQLHYRGMLDDFYLDNQALVDQTKVWKERLLSPDPNMLLILAEDVDQLLGFGCLFLDDNPKFGALLDNLHVVDTHQGMGIGSSLMKRLIAVIIKRSSRSDMYLWVIRGNANAIRFYHKLGGRQKESAIENGLGNNPVEKLRYYWPDVNGMLIE